MRLEGAEIQSKEKSKYIEKSVRFECLSQETQNRRYKSKDIYISIYDGQEGRSETPVFHRCPHTVVKSTVKYVYVMLLYMSLIGKSAKARRMV